MLPVTPLDPPLTSYIVPQALRVQELVYDSVSVNESRATIGTSSNVAYGILLLRVLFMKLCNNEL